jgi:GTPase SAR1 family protein
MSNLVLGWEVTAGLEPKYWLTENAKPGAQKDDDLVAVPAKTMETHTVIIGQSGSGKSFFLGRLIEELLLNTKARCIILDSNADFRKINEVKSDKLWKQAVYRPIGKGEGLPHEPSQDDFKIPWSRIRKIKATANINIFDKLTNKEVTYKALKFWWPSLSIENVIDEEDPSLRTQLYHCHSFVNAIGHLVVLKSIAERKNMLPGTFDDPISEAEKLYNIWTSDVSAQNISHEITTNFETSLKQNYDIEKLVAAVQVLDKDTAALFGLRKYSGAAESPLSKSGVTIELLKKVNEIWNQIKITGWLQIAEQALRYVDEDAGRSYFGKANEYKAKDILTTNPQPNLLAEDRALIVDLPSLPDKTTRMLAVNAVLENAWDATKHAWEMALEKPYEEDIRTPIFILIDEAHNLIPAEPRSKAEMALREQFRTIAAEGRKYGLFLILASQRPDKLDKFVLSECENKALMKIDSESVLRLSCNCLGIDDIPDRTLRKCLEFGQGRILISGHWALGEHRLLYCAARRTVEGGRSLRSEYWAEPESNK